MIMLLVDVLIENYRIYITYTVLTLWVKKRPTILILTNFGKCWPIFKILSSWVQQEICNKTLVMFSTKHYLCSYTTLRNLKCYFYRFTTAAVTKKPTSKFISFFTEYNSYHLTRITITYFWLNSNCLSCARSVVSSLSSNETVCQVSATILCVSYFRLLRWERPTFI